VNFRTAYDGQTVAIIGAGGFIGRWVARELTRYGANLVLVVHTRSKAEPVFNEYGVRGTVVELDAANPNALSQCYGTTQPSITFNLAGYGVKHDEKSDGLHNRVNADLVGTLAEVISQHRDPGWAGQDLVHTGSALEYGEVVGDLREDTTPQPTTLYGKTKLAGTERLVDYCRSTELKALTARLFTVYGPGEYSQRLTPSLLRTAATNQPLKLSAGDQRRDFTYVREVAEGLLRLGVAPAAAGEIVNLATGRLVSVRDFVLLAAQVLDISQSLLQFGQRSGREGEMAHGDVNVAKLRRLTDWKPTISIEQGVRCTSDFFTALIDREDR
jgi:nucleoside-diphosphate-sugar epimerase